MLLNRNLFKKALLIINTVLASSVLIVFGIKDTRAEFPSCLDLNNPSIGSTCYTEVPYNVRAEHTKATQSFAIPQVALPGFVIVDTRDLQESRIGTTNGPSIIITRPGTALQIREAYEQAYQNFNDFYQKTKAEVQMKGVNFGGMSEIQQRTEEQFKNAINGLTQIQSNSEAIVIKGSAQAQWRTWLGVDEWTSGGTLRGRIRVYQRYIGTPAQANEILSNGKNQILSLIANTSSPNKNVACPATFSPVASQGRTGKVAFFNGWNSPVTVVLYDPSNRSVFNRFTVPPGQNNFISSNVVEDNWGVCFENKPEGSGVVNNVGIISDYNPNYQGSTLFMIQNPRIK